VYNDIYQSRLGRVKGLISSSVLKTRKPMKIPLEFVL
jgi:hypothetical protein